MLVLTDNGNVLGMADIKALDRSRSIQRVVGSLECYAGDPVWADVTGRLRVALTDISICKSTTFLTAFIGI